MFNEETLFILGAGASLPYGYPLGKDLINQIIDYIKNDFIYLPKIENLGYFYNENNGVEKNGELKDGYIFSKFIDHFKKNDITEFSDSTKKRTVAGSKSSFGIGATTYIETRLNQISDFYNLKNH
jgi:hypothetical protein